MKNKLYSLIWPLIALFFGAQFHTQISSKEASTLNSNAPETLEILNDFDCCSGDEEDPIVWGNVTDQNSSALSNANVEVIDNSTTTSLGNTTTDSNGDFAVRLDPGYYYFSITPCGQSAQNSPVYHIVNDTTIAIVLTI